MIRVLISTSSPILRAGLESLLKPEHFEVVSEEPDVVVVDEASQDLLDHPAVVVLTSDPQPSAAFELLRSGARAVIARDSRPDQIAAAIEAAAAGLVVLRPEDIEPWLGNHRPLEIAEPLTSRETEVLGMIAEGLANKVIAHRLGISEHTVKFHITSILAKLHAGSRTEAVTLGVRQGLIML